MRRNISPSFLFLFGVFVLLGGFFYFYNVSAQTGSITATVTLRGCGNGIIEVGEQCDNGGSNGACPATCSASCTTNSCGGGGSPGGGGGGGGGGGSTTPSTQVILQGLAYPGAEITVLKDGQVLTGGIFADSQANFKVALTTLTAGTYTFGFWAEDKQDRRSITFSFTVTVTSGITTTIGGIFIPPTIELAKTNLLKGETLKILGQTAPESEISVQIESAQTITKITTSTTAGDWNYLLDTSPLDEGMHTTRAKAETTGGLLSSFSKVMSFYIGKYGVGQVSPQADFNKDGKTNLVDFSVMLYWWGKYNPSVDMNQDGTVNLKDFSIMMYYWTG